MKINLLTVSLILAALMVLSTVTGFYAFTAFQVALVILIPWIIIGIGALIVALGFGVVLYSISRHPELWEEHRDSTGKITYRRKK